MATLRELLTEHTSAHERKSILVDCLLDVFDAAQDTTNPDVLARFQVTATCLEALARLLVP
jgi:hypothetical protein